MTGTSVLALTYKDGIMMAADNLGTFPPYLRLKAVLHQLIALL